MKKAACIVFTSLLACFVFSGCQKQINVNNTPAPLLEYNEELTDELISDIPYTYYGKNDNWEITLVIRQDTDKEAEIFQKISGDEIAYRTELFVKASEDMKQQILSGSLSAIVTIPREDGREFTSLLHNLDLSKKNNRSAAEEMLDGKKYWVIGENSEHYSTGLMMEKEESYKATVTTNNNSTDSSEEEIILTLEN